MTPRTPASSSDHASNDVDRLLAECLEQPPGEWQRSLDAACVSHPEIADELRRRVDHLRDTGMLDEPRARSDAGAPKRIGEFRIVRRLGGGGMGVVYLAVQESMKREVALKMVRPGPAVLLRESRAVPARSRGGVAARPSGHRPGVHGRRRRGRAVLRDGVRRRLHLGRGAATPAALTARTTAWQRSPAGARAIRPNDARGA